MIDSKKDKFQDKQLKCADCGSVFIFVAGEQFFFWSKGLATRKRCLRCRQRTCHPLSGRELLMSIVRCLH